MPLLCLEIDTVLVGVVVVLKGCFVHEKIGDVKPSAGDRSEHRPVPDDFLFGWAGVEPSSAGCSTDRLGGVQTTEIPTEALNFYEKPQF